MIKAQHIVKKSSNWSFKVIGNAPLEILKSFTLAMTLSTCMQAFATLEIVLQFFLETLFLSLKNGGMISLHPLLTGKSLILNLLSAIKLLPNWSFSTIPQVAVMKRGDEWIVPASVIHSNFFHVFLDLYAQYVCDWALAMLGFSNYTFRAINNTNNIFISLKTFWIILQYIFLVWLIN